MKKKFLAVASAVALFAMSSLPVFAATSPVTEGVASDQEASVQIEYGSATADAAGTTASAGVTVGQLSGEKYTEVTNHVIAAILNDVEAFAKAVGNNALAVAANDKGQTITANVLAAVDLSATGATKVGDYYNVTLNIAGVKAGDTIYIFHLTDAGWETFTGNAANGSVSFATKSFSPFAVVKVTTSKAGILSPKTGEAVSIVLALAALGAVGAVVCGKKFFAK